MHIAPDVPGELREACCDNHVTLRVTPVRLLSLAPLAPARLSPRLLGLAPLALSRHCTDGESANVQKQVATFLCDIKADLAQPRLMIDLRKGWEA